MIRGTPVTPITMLRQLARLLEVYPRPRWWPAEDELVARRWAEVCDDVSIEQLHAAVGAYIKGAAGFMPKVGPLHQLAREQRGITVPGALGGDPQVEFEAWVQRGYEDVHRCDLAPCPACGREWLWQPRLKLIHDHARHRALGLPCIGHCDEASCIGPGATIGAAQSGEGAAA